MNKAFTHAITSHWDMLTGVVKSESLMFVLKWPSPTSNTIALVRAITSDLVQALANKHEKAHINIRSKNFMCSAWV